MSSNWQPSQRYPDSTVVAVDESFNRYKLALAKVERLATGLTRWAEGPVWFGDQRCLVWSDVPGNCMWRSSHFRASRPTLSFAPLPRL